MTAGFEPESARGRLRALAARRGMATRARDEAEVERLTREILSLRQEALEEAWAAEWTRDEPAPGTIVATPMGDWYSRDDTTPSWRSWEREERVTWPELISRWPDGLRVRFEPADL